MFEGGSDIELKINFVPSPDTKGLSILPGSLKLSTIEDVLGNAFTQAMAGNKLGYFQTSAIFRFLIEKGMQEQIDIFVIDTSPSLGTLNRAVQKVREFLAHRHSRNGLVEQSWPKPLAIIQDYGQLAPYSQENCSAIFHIKPEDSPPGTQENIEKSKKAFSELADGISSLLTSYV